INQAHPPASFVAVDRHGNFSFGGWMSDGILENEKVGAELSNGQNVAVDAQLDANIGGVTGALQLESENPAHSFPLLAESRAKPAIAACANGKWDAFSLSLSAIP